jgi:hypothetical protein
MSAYTDAVAALSDVRVWYRLDEASGLIQDSSGNALHTTSSAGTLTYEQDGGIASEPTDKSILFTAGRFWIGDDSQLDLGDVVTLFALIKLNSTSNSGGIVSKGINAYYMRYLHTTSKFEFLKSNAAVIVASSNTFNDTTDWHLLVARKNAGTAMHLFHGTVGNDDFADVTGTVSNATLADNTNALVVGDDLIGGTEPWDHFISEIIVSGAAESDSAIEAVYDSMSEVVEQAPFVIQAPVIIGG